ncbi:hypothetical protein L2X99_09220 [Microbacterium sp. KUDC0406]|uniref:hypothetical protein n=1 Tax=Microbacterium sp. KUDC0406 TaxID=2909588 RepID=UPI001F346D33|nr:hypothetical protein [Microbacterium sp. KUDC0406]UJP08707.1 hypothetical protein L2X99_09220 [Microbacterium sp. KUDC0406]
MPLEGRFDTASELLAFAAPETTFTIASVNGVPGLVLAREQTVVAVLTAEGRSALISRIWMVCNPDKLRQWNR